MLICFNINLLYMSKKENVNKPNKHLDDNKIYSIDGKYWQHGHEVKGLALIMGDITKNQGRMIGLFALLIIISGNFLGDLFPKDVRVILNNNIYIKHIFGFLTLFFFVFLTMPELQSEGIGMVFGVYFLFLISSKLKSSVWFTLVFFITLLYLLELYEQKLIEHYKKHEDDSEGVRDMKYITFFDNWLRPGTLLGVIFIGFYGFINMINRYFKISFNKRPNFLVFLFKNDY